MIAETPQIDVPTASSVESLPPSPKRCPTRMITVVATAMSMMISRKLKPPSLARSPSRNRAPSNTIPIFNQNS